LKQILLRHLAASLLLNPSRERAKEKVEHALLH
jgi:hypothetical protein